MAISIDELVSSEQKSHTGTRPALYVSGIFEAGRKIWMPSAISIAFDMPTEITLNSLKVTGQRMFVAHYSNMWITAGKPLKAVYAFSGDQNERPSKWDVMVAAPTRIYVSPVDSGSVEAVLTGKRRDEVTRALRGEKYMMETLSPQLVRVDDIPYVNIDQVPMLLTTAASITPKAKGDGRLRIEFPQKWEAAYK